MRGDRDREGASPRRHADVLVYRDLGRAEKRWCTAKPDLNALKTGMSDADVAAVGGVPDDVLLHCWLYGVTRDREGRRVCFTNGRVTTLQFSLHG